MGNYHPDERPMIYSSLGYAGQFVGALSTYKHNLFEQWSSRTMKASPLQLRDQATGKFSPGLKVPDGPAATALVGMMAAGLLFYGVNGLPGAQEADLIYQSITGKTMRDTQKEILGSVGDNPKTGGNTILDGYLSASTGYDWQSRLSMANAIPDNPAAGLAGPYLADTFNVMMRAIEYAKEQDIKSRNQFLNTVVPLSAKGPIEHGLMTNQEGYIVDKEGQRKYSEKRTDKESLMRSGLGVRPLRERLEDEDLFAKDRLWKKITDKQKEALVKEKAALNWGDESAAKAARDKFLEEGGDPAVLKDTGRYKRIVEDAGLTARQRRILAPKNSIGSINKYKEYNE